MDEYPPQSVHPSRLPQPWGEYQPVPRHGFSRADPARIFNIVLRTLMDMGFTNGPMPRFNADRSTMHFDPDGGIVTFQLQDGDRYTLHLRWINEETGELLLEFRTVWPDPQAGGAIFGAQDRDADPRERIKTALGNLARFPVPEELMARTQRARQDEQRRAQRAAQRVAMDLTEGHPFLL